MKFGSVCSGVEAASLAWMPLGWECKFVSEIEPFPCAVLQHRFGASAPINQLDPNEIIITDEEWALIDELKKVNKDWMKACDNADLISRFKERKQREAWIKDNALLNKEGKIPNEGDFTKIGKKYAGQIDLLVGGTPCFVAGTMVLTPTGYVPIESLNVGDIVISGEGIERKVKAIGHKFADIGAIKILGRPEIFCTENHPFMCLDIKRDNQRKSPTYSQNIPVGDFYKVPAGEAVGKYVGRVKVVSTAAPLLPKVYDATAEQIMELAGWYLGDGYIRKWTGSNKKAVVFALCNQQKIDTFGERFGDALNYSISNDGKVTVACTALANWLSEQFGEHSENKRIPYWCYSHACKCALLRGYRSTDGCEQEKEYKFTTVSKALAYGMADMMGDASVTFTKTPDTATINGRTINQKDCYCVHFYKNTPIKTKKYKERYASKIRSFVYAGTDIVYNITVAEDHTYIANGIYVHNCQDLSIAGKRAGFDGERSSLAIDFVRLAYESQCKWFVWKNVPGVFSSNEGRDFATLLSLFTGSKVEVQKDGWGTAGFVCNARRDRYGVAWRTLDGQFTRTQRFPFAVPQRRRRVFLVGYFGDWTRAAEVLLESGRSKWDTPSRFKAREILAEIARADSALANGELRRTGEGSTDRHWDASGVNPTLNQCNAGSGTPGASNQELFAQNFNGLVTSIGNGQVDGLINPPELAQTLNCMHDQQAVLCYKNHMPDKGKLPCVIEQKTASGASFEINYGCPVEEELSHTLKCGTALGSYSGVIETAVGCDMYNHALTGDASKTLNSAATDSDHVPTVISAYNGAGDETAVITPNGEDLSDTLDANYYKGSGARAGTERPIICFNDQGGSVMSVESDGNAGTLRANTHGNEQIVCGDLVQTLKIRSGCEGGGKGPLVQDELSATLGCGNDQTLFVVHGAHNPDVISMHNKQFGQCEENIASTLLSTDYKEPQIVCYDNQTRARNPMPTGDVSCTMQAAMGEGGNNVPLVQCYKADSLVEYPTAMIIGDHDNRPTDLTNLVQECYAIDSMGSNAMKSSNPYSGFHKEEIAKTLDTTDPNPSKNQGGNVIVSYDCYNQADCGDIARTLSTEHHGTNLNVIASSINCQGGSNINVNNDITETLTAATNSSGNNLLGVCCSVDRRNQSLNVECSNTLNTCEGGDNYNTVITKDAIGLDGYNAALTGDSSATLGVNCGMSTGRNGVINSIAFEPGIAKRDGGDSRFTEDVCGTLRSNMGDNQTAACIAIDGDKLGKAERKGGSGLGVSEKDVMYTQTAKDVHAVCTNEIASTVRRLLPIECERLMGFPDNHTRIPWKGLKEEDCPDSSRYKACGNSFCVNVVQWIGEQIDKVEKRK